MYQFHRYEHENMDRHTHYVIHICLSRPKVKYMLGQGRAITLLIYTIKKTQIYFDMFSEAEYHNFTCLG